MADITFGKYCEVPLSMILSIVTNLSEWCARRLCDIISTTHKRNLYYLETRSRT